MSKSWKIILIALFTLLFSGLVYWFYDQYHSLKEPHANTIAAIDEEVVLFMQTSDIRSAVYKLTSESSYWEKFQNQPALSDFKEKFLHLDSLFSSVAEINHVFELHPVTIALEKNEQAEYDILFIAELPPGDKTPSIESFIKESIGPKSIVLKKEFSKTHIQTLNLENLEQLFYFSVYKGLFMGSFDLNLIEKSIRRLDTGRSWEQDAYFSRIRSTAGKNVEANIYVHLPNFILWADKHVKGPFKENLQRIKGLGYWTELDLLINERDLLFNGYTITSDSSGKLLNSFRHAPQSIHVTQVLPFHIQWLIHWGIEDMSEFLDRKHQPASLTTIISNYKKKYSIDLDHDFLAWQGNEIALTTFQAEKDRGTPLVVIHASDVVQAVLSLGEMESKVSKVDHTNSYILKHQDINIRRLGLTHLFRDLFGQSFPVMKDCYYTVIKDYVVFGDNVFKLVDLIDHFYSRKTLHENQSYQAFADNISDRSNIYLYANLNAGSFDLPDYFTGQTGALIVDPLAGFDVLALQFSYFNKMFYTNMFTSYNPAIVEVRVSDWNTKLEANLTGKPHTIRNHRNGKTNIIVFDDNNNMSLIDHVGRIQWQLPLIEKPFYQVFPIDFYDNGKLQYLFNTENYVYLVDLNGNYVADFPHKMETSMTGPLACFDYENTGNYRILVGMSDNRVSNFDKNLKEVEGWNKIQSSATVEQEVEHLEKGGKDYFFISDKNGGVRVTDRRGMERIQTKGKVNKARNSAFYINRTNDKGDFLTSDKKGNVVYIDGKGRLKNTNFGKFSPDHFFFYMDYNQDDHMDFVFVDGDQMTVFNRFKKVIVTQQFDENILLKPIFFKWAGSVLLGVVYSESGEIQLFDHQGRRFSDHFIEGNTPFESCSFEEGELNLLTGKGNILKNYLLN